MSGGRSRPGWRAGTRLVQGGRRKGWTNGIVNPAVWRASTVLFDDVEALRTAAARPDDQLYYGRRGTPTQWALADALTELEPGAAGTLLFPSGTAAIATALLSVLQPGDELLMVDSAYEPTRAICRGLLARYGIATRFYDPLVGAGIAELIGERTRAIFLESPGSLTFEVQDVPAIVTVARERGLATLIDNTWATPLFFPAIARGIDLTIMAATKYVVGHSDAMLGSVTASPAAIEALRNAAVLLGQCVSPDDAFLGSRGLRTMGVRLRAHERGGLEVARWLAGRPEIAAVLHPALPGCPGHAIWARDFTGASGLFTIILASRSDAARVAFVDALELFGIGFSWGGFESLALPIDPERVRSATRWQAPGLAVRLHVGLEDPADLIADLAQALGRYAEIA